MGIVLGNRVKNAKAINEGHAKNGIVNIAMVNMSAPVSDSL